MKSTFCLTCLACVIVGMLVGQHQTAAQQKAVPNVVKWEYKMAFNGSVPVIVTEKALNELGKDGWELVTVSDAGYFKRPKQ